MVLECFKLTNILRAVLSGRHTVFGIIDLLRDRQGGTSGSTNFAFGVLLVLEQKDSGMPITSGTGNVACFNRHYKQVYNLCS